MLLSAAMLVALLTNHLSGPLAIILSSMVFTVTLALVFLRKKK